MYWSMSLKDHFKITHNNITVTNHFVKNEGLLLLVWKGLNHHFTIRSKDVMKKSLCLELVSRSILAQMFHSAMFSSRWDAINFGLHNL